MLPLPVIMVMRQIGRFSPFQLRMGRIFRYGKALPSFTVIPVEKLSESSRWQDVRLKRYG